MQLFHFYSIFTPHIFFIFVLCLVSSSLYCIRKLSLGREPGRKKGKNKSVILLICFQVHQLSETSSLLLSSYHDFCFHFSYCTFQFWNVYLHLFVILIFLLRFPICALIKTIFSFNYLNIFSFISFNTFIIAALKFLDHIFHFLCICDFCFN